MTIAKEDEEEEQENSSFTFYTDVNPAFIGEVKTYNYVAINADAAINHFEETKFDEVM